MHVVRADSNVVVVGWKPHRQMVVGMLVALCGLVACGRDAQPSAARPSQGPPRAASDEPDAQRVQGYFADLRNASGLGAFLELNQVLDQTAQQLGRYVLTDIDLELPSKKDGRHLSFDIVLRSDASSTFREKGAALLAAIKAVARYEGSCFRALNDRQTGERYTFQGYSEGYVLAVRIDLKSEDDYPVFEHEKAGEGASKDVVAVTPPDLFFERQIRDAASRTGDAAFLSDFQFSELPDQGARRGKAVDSLISITWKEAGREPAPLRRDFILAMLLNVESPASPWKLRELRMRNAAATSRGKVPPKEASDLWKVSQMIFARRQLGRAH